MAEKSFFQAKHWHVRLTVHPNLLITHIMLLKMEHLVGIDGVLPLILVGSLEVWSDLV